MTSRAVNPRLQFARQLDAHDLRARQVKGAATHRHGHVQPSGADGQHPQAPSVGRVAVGTQQRLARYGEPLQVHLVADAVAGTGTVRPVLGRNRLQIAMVVRIAEIRLDHVVVDVGHRTLGAHAGQTHGLEFEPHHRTRGILGQSLIDLDGDLLSGDHVARDQVIGDDLVCQRLRHWLARLRKGYRSRTGRCDSTSARRAWSLDPRRPKQGAAAGCGHTAPSRGPSTRPPGSWQRWV